MCESSVRFNPLHSQPDFNPMCTIADLIVAYLPPLLRVCSALCSVTTAAGSPSAYEGLLHRLMGGRSQWEWLTQYHTPIPHLRQVSTSERCRSAPGLEVPPFSPPSSEERPSLPGASGPLEAVQGGAEGVGQHNHVTCHVTRSWQY